MATNKLRPSGVGMAGAAHDATQMGAHIVDERGAPLHTVQAAATLATEDAAAIKASLMSGTAMPPASGGDDLRAQPASPEGAPADAAAAFADGHVDPVRAPLAASGGSLTGASLTGAPLMLSLIGRMTRDERRALLADIELREAHVLLTHPDLRAALEADAGSSSTDGYILIVSATPGFRRAGLLHPSRAEYPLDFFTAEQLRAIRAEPQLQMVAIGGEPVPHPGRAHTAPPAPRVDPLLAGRAAADAISQPPKPSEPGLRNAAAGDGFRGRVGTFG